MTGPARQPLRAPGPRRFDAMAGVGGIGSGSFFLLSGDHTLGREESRGGRFIDRRDYCKLHIISHYVKALMGPGYPVLPAGKVGDDDVGSRLLREMTEAGLDTRLVQRVPGVSTLFSFCFIYPDGSGGNMTTEDSACARVDAGLVSELDPVLTRHGARGVALAAPEVPLPARRALLDLATARGSFRVASFTSAEMAEAVGEGFLPLVDLLAINEDEAAAAAGIPADGEPARIVEQAVRRLTVLNPKLNLAITAGRHGSWTWDGARLNHVAPAPVEIVSTAGAGDAHLAGIIAGLSAGLALAEAQEIGILAASHSVTSPHTIDDRIDASSLAALALRTAFPATALTRRALGLT